MTSILKALAVSVTLVVGTVIATGSAYAGQDQTYHWAYPDNLKGHPTVQSSGVGSGIPPLYR